MQHPDESGTPPIDDGPQELCRVIHGMIDTASSIAANLEMIVQARSCVDQALLDDVRQSLGRLVALAHEAQRIRGLLDRAVAIARAPRLTT